MVICKYRYQAKDMDDNIKTIVEEVKKYFDVKQTEIIERFDKVDQKFEQIDQRFDKVDQKFSKVDERFDKLENKIQTVFEQVVANTEDLAIVKSDLGTIKHELKRKVSYDEFAALEQRVIAIESKMAKVN